VKDTHPKPGVNQKLGAKYKGPYMIAKIPYLNLAPEIKMRAQNLFEKNYVNAEKRIITRGRKDYGINVI
jgi:hypothetical protein